MGTYCKFGVQLLAVAVAGTAVGVGLNLWVYTCSAHYDIVDFGRVGAFISKAIVFGSLLVCVLVPPFAMLARSKFPDPITPVVVGVVCLFLWLVSFALLAVVTKLYALPAVMATFSAWGFLLNSANRLPRRK